MAVGFGYIKDDKPSQVDWGQITKDANASLKSIEKDRQGRRDKIDENQREFTKMLAERPTGGDVVYQKWMGKYSAMTSAAMLENLNKLKRGDIGEQEFNTFRATVAGGVEGMIATGKGYIAGFDKAAELQLGNGSALTKWQNTQSQFLFDLENVEPYIDPITGETTYFLLKEDGEKEVVNVSQGLRRVVAKAEAFDTEGTIDKILEAPINEFENNLGGKEKGQFLTREMVDGVEQIVVNSDYIRTSARSAVQQGSHVFDILNLDKTGYEIAALPTEYYALNTQEERDDYLKELHKDTSVLYVDKNDRPLESEAQRTEAEDYIVEQVKDGAQIGIKETPALKTTNDMGKAYDRFRLGLELVNRAGKKIPDYLLKLALRVPGMDAETADTLFSDLTFEDKDTKTTAQKDDDLEKIRNRKIATASDKWYESVFLREAVIAEDDEGFSIDKINEFLLDTPYTVDDDTREVKFGDETIYTFDKENYLNYDVRASDIKTFKRKLKALLDTQQEVLLYFSENPDMMTKDWDSDTTETKTDKYNKNR